MGIEALGRDILRTDEYDPQREAAACQVGHAWRAKNHRNALQGVGQHFIVAQAVDLIHDD